MSLSRGQCFRDAALYKLANAKRRILGLRENCRLLKPGVIQDSGHEGFSRAKNFASRTKGGGATHLTELLRQPIKYCPSPASSLPSAQTLNFRLRQIRHVALDLDGTTYSGGKLFQHTL